MLFHCDPAWLGMAGQKTSDFPKPKPSKFDQFEQVLLSCSLKNRLEHFEGIAIG